MSQSTPICSLFCSRCKAESRKSIGHYDRDHIRNYLDVIVVGETRTGNAALCKCRKCGHEYISKSRAAIRALRRLGLKAASV